MSGRTLALTSLLLAAIPVTPLRADWPTYLHDASRVGQTEESIQTPLTLRWTFESPTAPELAWAGEDGRVIEGKELFNRIRFDDVFHVAISGNRMFFGSSVDGLVHGRNLLTGEDDWTFVTDAPVRLAPMVADGRVYIGSDDGYAYCLDEGTGKVIWKLRAGPNDERILARGRMISRWPVRTGILVDDGVAYFGAGVFPHENIYLYAVDAGTGKVVWKNDAISQLDAGRNDLSPQGYLLASKDTLFVPSGRALCASFDRKTGEYQNQPTPSWRGDAGGQIGGTQAFLADDQIYSVGEHQILAMDQDKGKTGFGWFRGRQMTLAGDMGYMADGKSITAIDRIQHAEGTRERHQREMAAYKINSAIRKHPAIAEAKKLQSLQSDFQTAQGKLDKLSAAGTTSGADHAKALADVAKKQEALQKLALSYEPKRLDYQAQKDEAARLTKEAKTFDDAGVKWQFETPHQSALILAGNLLFVGGENEVICLDGTSGEEVWKTEVEGEARGLAASNGHLVVSTSAGKIYTFGDASIEAPLPPEEARQPVAAADPFPNDPWSQVYADAAEAILAQSGVTKGFCLVLGNEDGRLAYELAKRSELIIFGVDDDANKVASSRQALLKSGLYGPRLTVDHLDLSVIPYGSYFANLIVSDSLLKTGVVSGDAKAVARHLKPIGGQFCFGLPESSSKDLKAPAAKNIHEWLASTGLESEQATIADNGGWTRLTRAKLPGADDWSHQYGNAANTSSNSDERVKGGLSVLWYGDPGPGKMVNRHAGAVGPISVNGRLFIQGEETMMAYDSYNGQQLWEVENPGAMRDGLKAAYEPGNMAATDDSLFMVVEDKCHQFDAATGETVRVYTVPGDRPAEERQWGYIATEDGLLYGTATDRKELTAERARRGRTVADATDMIFAFDTRTGKLSWSYQGKHISHVSIAIGDGGVYLVDASLTPEQREEMLKQDKSDLVNLTGKAKEIAEDRIKTADLRLAVGLDAKTGKQLWAKPVDVTDCSEIGDGGGSLTMIYHNGRIVLGGANANGHYWEQFLSGQFERRRLVVLDANNGEKIWAKDANYRHRPIIIGNEVIAEPWSYDLYTGEQKTRQHPLTGEDTPWMFARPGHHCGAISATPNMMFFRSKFTAYYNRDLDEGTQHFAGHRLGCWINTIPANGLVMIPEASAGCVCLFSIASTVVFEPRDDRINWGVYSARGLTTPVQHMALNFGAPGDRRDEHGKLWLGYPRPSSRSGMDLDFDLKPTFAKAGDFFTLNSESHTLAGTASPWIFVSGARGLERCELPLIATGETPDTYTVRLSFAPLETDKPGQRIFDVKLQGKTVLKGFDPAAQEGGPHAAFVAEFEKIPVTDTLVVELIPAANSDGDPLHQTLMSGIEVLRTDASEILEEVAVK